MGQHATRHVRRENPARWDARCVTADEDRDFVATMLDHLGEVWSRRSWTELGEYFKGNPVLLCGSVRSEARRLVDSIEKQYPGLAFTVRRKDSDQRVEAVSAYRHATRLLEYAPFIVLPNTPSDAHTSAVLGFLEDMSQPELAELLLENAHLYDCDGLAGSYDMIDSLLPENNVSVGRRLIEIRKLLTRCADDGVATAVAEADFQVPFPHLEFPPVVVELIESAWSGSGDRLGELIELYKMVRSSAAVDLMSPDELGDMHHAISNAYRDRYRREHSRDDIDRSIECDQLALTAYATPELANLTLADLAVKFGERFIDRGDIADLEQSFTINESLLLRFSKGSSEWLHVAATLGTDLNDRSRRFDNPADLTRAREVLADAVEIATERHSDKLPRCQHQLALALQSSYEFSGTLAFLTDSADLHRHSVMATRRSDPSWSVRVQALGERLRQLFNSTGDEDALDESITVLRDLLQSGLGTPSTRYGVRNNLALSLANRFELRDDQADIDAAIGLLDDLLEMEPPTSSIRPGHVVNLASCLLSRQRTTPDQDGLDRALELFESADLSLLAPTRLGYARSLRWATALAVRYYRIGADADLVRAVGLFRELCISAANTGAAEVGWKSSMQWAEWAASREDWPEAVEAYQHVLAFAEQWYSRQHTAGGRGEVARLLGAEAWEMAYACGKAGDAPLAVTMLEQARCLWLDEVMESDTAALAIVADVDPALYREWVDTRTRLTDLPDSGAVVAVRAQEVLDELATLRERIRQLPGLNDFQRRQGVREVQEKAARGPIVYLITTVGGGFAFIATEAEVRSVELPGLTSAAFGERFRAYMAAEDRSTSERRDVSELDLATEWLWTNVVSLLEESLVGIDAIVLIPVGTAVYLPWHAARATDDDGTTRYWSDSCRITYAPSARVLGASVEGHPGAVLAVGDPVGGKLRWSMRELEVAAAEPGSLVITGNEATPGRVFDLIRDYDVVHFACHGKVNVAKPMYSALVLADSSLLAVKHFARRRLEHLRLAVLSACDSAFPSMDLINEAVGFPAMLMSAGVGAVIGTLWPVADRSTALLMERFYDNWRAGLPPAEALRSAQQWMRSGPYAHPYYWAGFVYYGR